MPPTVSNTVGMSRSSGPAHIVTVDRTLAGLACFAVAALLVGSCSFSGPETVRVPDPTPAPVVLVPTLDGPTTVPARATTPAVTRTVPTYVRRGS